MERLDRVKNITGLVEWFAKNKRLRELVNLVVVVGDFDPSKSSDREEVAEIEKMHGLIKEYNLNGQFRWICAQKNRVRNGELYRYICDMRGAFIQVSLLHLVVFFKQVRILHPGVPYPALQYVIYKYTPIKFVAMLGEGSIYHSSRNGIYR